MNNRDVPIEVVSRHGHVSARMEDYAIKKAERLLKFNDRITRIEIVVDGPHEEPVVEMIVHANREATLVARDQDHHFNGAIDGLIQKMERQLVRAKEKRKHHKGDDALKDLGDQDEDVDAPPDSFDDAVRRDLDQ